MKNKEKMRGTTVSTRLLPEGLFIVIVAIAIVVNVILFILTEAFGLYLYSPEVDDLSISGNTDALFADAISKGKKVTISFCQDEASVKKHGTGNYVYNTVKEFEKRYPDLIDVEFINILTRRNSKGELVSLSKYRKDMRGYDTDLFKSSVIFECGNNYRVLTDAYTGTGYADFYTLDSDNQVTSYNGEEVVAGMINWVLTNEHKTAYFTQLHGEITDINFANMLSVAGYYIDVIDLKKNEVPDDAALVIISNPSADFEKAYEGSGVRAEIDRLKTYVDNGGNLFVALDPYVKELPALEGFLAERGIALSYHTDKNGKKIRNMVKDIRNAITTDGFTLVTVYGDGDTATAINDRVSSFSTGKVIIRESGALSLSGTAEPILLSSKNSSLEAGGAKTDTGGGYCVGAYASVGDGNIFVVPSIYLAVSDSLVTNGYSNKEFVFSLFEDVFGAHGMPYGCKSVTYDTYTLEGLTMGTAIGYTIFFMCIPALIAIAGAVVLIRRKNR